MAKDYDYLLKVLLVGDSDVGKHEIMAGLEDASSESPFCSRSGNCKFCTYILNSCFQLLLNKINIFVFVLSYSVQNNNHTIGW